MGAQQSQAGTQPAEQQQAQQENKQNDNGNQQSSLPKYTYSELALHNTPGDCWIAISGRIYDVSKFLRYHPGGQDLILDVAGKDATVEFHDAHHPELVTRDELPTYLVGVLDESDDESVDTKPPRLLVLVGSQKGTGMGYAEYMRGQMQSKFGSQSYNIDIVSMDNFDPDDLAKEKFVIFIISTYTEGSAPAPAEFFTAWMKDAAVDFRVGPQFMNGCYYAVLGLGNSIYEQHYNVCAKRLYSQLPALGGTSLCDMGAADDNVSRDSEGTSEDDMKLWLNEELLPALTLAINQPEEFDKQLKIKQSKLKTAQRAAARLEKREKARLEREQKKQEEKAEHEACDSASDNDYDSGDDYDEDEDEQQDDDEENDGEKVVDLEELGSVLGKKKEGETQSKEQAAPAGPRPMLTDALRKNLGKQGYKLIGTHSGVKLCRWTKAMLRGKGGCYKHTFYGIISFQCMEMTPSLACANKCVFCWRTHTNPVGKEWKWQIDPPRMILDAGISNHRKMINEMKGVPGVLPERLAEANTPKHCALSLVGEPIMYPHINEFSRMLHEENISSFLVTNAQFPDKIRDMEPVCQLYVSIDASTQDSLKAVDRPLFSDFWERFIGSLEAIRHKKQRTVYRMTLVKTFNMQEVVEYAKLVAIGRPTFIEIKGVTFCGKSNAGGITLRDVPLHEEVKNFAEQLCKYLDGNYELACEHQHSCCILISDTRLKVNGKWHTWIDYPKFNQLVREYYATGKEFSAEDYGCETPAWAVYGAQEAGFSPHEQRKERKKARPTIEQLEDKFGPDYLKTGGVDFREKLKEKKSTK